MLLSLVAVVGLGACSSGKDLNADSGGRPHSSSTPAKRPEVTISTFMFGPKRLVVPVGTTVRWTNTDDILHTATSGHRTYDPTDSGKVIATDKDGGFDLPLDGKGSSATFTFTQRGDVHYFCDRHPGMEADIAVT
jgi:plastocyanin